MKRKIASVAGLLADCELDEALGLILMIHHELCDISNGNVPPRALFRGILERIGR